MGQSNHPLPLRSRPFSLWPVGWSSRSHVGGKSRRNTKREKPSILFRETSYLHRPTHRWEIRYQTQCNKCIGAWFEGGIPCRPEPARNYPPQGLYTPYIRTITVVETTVFYMVCWRSAMYICSNVIITLALRPPWPLRLTPRQTRGRCRYRLLVMMPNSRDRDSLSIEIGRPPWKGITRLFAYKLIWVCRQDERNLSLVAISRNLRIRFR